ncbi:MAG: AMP-binding protein, partial [Lachnospiraceae bacterium]|nr:AMP-binding protein [Lachnospiraceae bacterium]
TGELVVESGSVSLGYADDYNDLCRGDDNGGCLHTGDLAVIDSSGHIHLKGRIKRIAKLLGERINLDDIEELLKKEYTSCGFACTDIDEHMVVAYDSPIIDGHEIKKILSERVGIQRQMVETIYIETIPRLSNGKVDYQGVGDLINGQE